VNAICIIPARGGSRRIEHKNIRDFRGKPIIAYSIEAAIATRLFGEVIVSTDDARIEAVARSCGAWVARRPAYLAVDYVGTQAVAAYTLRSMACDEEYCCVIYPTAPLMTVEDLHLGFEQLRTSQAPYVYAVGPDWKDAGQWYWGRTLDFTSGTSLDQAALYRLPAARTCDINVEADWLRAEQLYGAMYAESTREGNGRQAS
jgi:pseudaminic acid cytidylyltransferase